jgi:hypothetical protein
MVTVKEPWWVTLLAKLTRKKERMRARKLWQAVKDAEVKRKEKDGE